MAGASSTAGSSPGTKCDPSISRISPSTRAEIALPSLGIQASMSRKEPPARLPANCGRRSDARFRLGIPLMANASRSEEMHRGYQSSASFGKQPNLLICCGIASEEDLCQVVLALCQWQLHGRMAAFCHMRPKLGGGVRQRKTARDSELMHSQPEGGSLHSKTLRSAIGTGHNPIAMFKSLKNLLTLRFLQHVTKCAICFGIQTRGSFFRMAGVGEFQISHVDAQGGTRRDDYRALYHILKFSYVPRPMVSAQGI